MKPQTQTGKRDYNTSDYQQNPVSTLFLLTTTLLFWLIVGCEAISPSNLSNVEAIWDENEKTLQVSGNILSDKEFLEIKDAASGELIGAAAINSDGEWQVSSSTPSCEILINEKESFAVQNSPESCSRSKTLTRAAIINDIPEGVLVTQNPEPLNDIPNAIILSPPTDISVAVGQVVNFAGVVSGFSVTPPVSYYWNFGGAAPNTTVQNPGAVVFNRPGTYFIQLSVTDNLGIPDPTPAIRTVVVGGGNTPVANTPVPVIASPVAAGGAVSIDVGDSLFFSGSASDATGSNTFFFEWNFSGAAQNQFGPTPGNIQFNNAGTYIVSLYATNALGTRSAVPDTLTVNVGTGTGINQAPRGSIVSPSQDVTINAGDSLSFRARGRDPDGNEPLYYSWDFSGLAQNIYMSTSRNGGEITFNTPGMYYIMMTVTDSLGEADPTPAMRIITVQNGSTIPGQPVNPLAGQIISPPSDVTIAPGQSVFFSAQASTTVPGQLQYFWTFDGAAQNSNFQTPGDITFPVAGQFSVQLLVADANGNVIGAPARRTITVTGSGNSQLAASIVSPEDNTSVQVGQPVFLSAQAPSVFGLSNIRYNWRIRARGAATDIFTSSELSPGSFVFPQAGTFRIRFRISGIEPISGNRVSESARSTVTVTDPFVAASPIISQPPQDMVVNIGQTVFFQASPVPGTNIRYRWDFDGQAQDSSQATPPPVVFNQAGTYVVRLRVRGTSVTGAPLNLDEQRIISVNASLPPNPFPGPSPFPPSPFPTQPPVGGAATPEGIIDTPVGNQTVRVGSAIQFAGRGFDPLGGGQLQFLWSFGGAAPNISSQFPGTVSFNRVGNYAVTLLVVNAFGQVDPTPATVVITVVP